MVSIWLCVSLHSCEGACGGLEPHVGATLSPAFLISCYTGLSGVESLSDLIDGDPPESMRPGKQDSPSLWQARRPSVGGRRDEGCVCDVHA